MDTPTLTKYLIGPGLYPPYVRIARFLTVLLSVFTLIGLVSAIFEFSMEPYMIAERCGEVLGLGLRVILMALGALTLVFTAIQRFDISLPKGLFREPRTLPPVEDVDRISLDEIARGIVLPAVSFICFNGYVDDFAWSWGQSYYSVTFDALRERLAWINMTLLLYMALHVVLLVERNWHWYTRLAKLMAEGLVVLLVFLIAVALGQDRAAMEEAGLAPRVVQLIIYSSYAVVVGAVAVAARELARMAGPLTRALPPRMRARGGR